MILRQIFFVYQRTTHTARRERDAIGCQFYPEVLLSMTVLLMRIWSSQGKFCLREHMPFGGSIFDVDCHVVKFLQLKLKIIL